MEQSLLARAGMDPVQEGAILAPTGPQTLDRRRVVIDVQTVPDAFVHQHRGKGLLKLCENVKHKPPPSEERPQLIGERAYAHALPEKARW
jgi:hypothetical protein